MVSNVYLTLFLLLKTVSEMSARPVDEENAVGRSRRQIEGRTAGVYFKIKGVGRGMLEVSRSDASVVVSEWQSGDSSSSSTADRDAHFTFCHSGSVISEIGHVSVMEVCQAGSPHKKLVLDSASRGVFVRTPLPRDEVLEAVIYENQHFFLRPADHHQEVLVSELEGTVGRGATATPQVVSAAATAGHVEVVRPVHLADIENRGDRNARWEVRLVSRGGVV